MLIQQTVAENAAQIRNTTLVINNAILASMPHEAAKDPASDKDNLIVQSRFGTLEFNPANAVFFPQGLLGLSANLHFGITEIPGKNMGQFRLLQCLNDPTVSFVVLPIDLENTLIERKDMDECCTVLNISAENLLTLLIVTVKRNPEGVEVTANVRAPVVIDTRDKAGIQYVFPHNKYDIRTPLARKK